MKIADQTTLAKSDTLLTAGNSLTELTATEFLRIRAKGQISALDYVQACLDRIEALDSTVQAWKVFDRERAERRARQDDAQDPQKRGRIGGVPVGVKDIFNTYDFPTSMGSPIMENYTPGNDARVVSDIRLEGGLVLGKTITAEFAVHSPGPTKNPWSLDRSPGTSSSGSAVAVATRMVPVALATQTGGSIIRPASYCGIAGFKPSFGLIPRTAMLKTTDTLDTVGFLARSTDDLQLMFETCRVRGHNYPVSETALNEASRQQTPRRWRVGIVNGPKASYESVRVKSAIDDVARKLENAGCEVFQHQLPEPYSTVHDLHDTIYRRALAYYFKTEWASHADLFSASMHEMVEGGIAITPAKYMAAIEQQNSFRQRFDAETEAFDVLICPSTSDEAPLGLHAPDLPDHCLIWTFVGAPVIGLPVLTGSTGLPVGLQIVGRRFADYKLLAFARFAEEVLLSRTAQ
ncbi:amidase [Tardiphaga alba]|uniref:Amidase n=1 Tax=Tardiphaga alba TaxID=340268 RepID=A0ABX8A7X2_9BRAD|nr:amidase [Tardiphaga alba]QUS39116.1 amidase [Tardiphaga alba]